MMIALDRYALTGHNLGVEGKRFAAVWMHGCHRGCKGCIAANRNAAPAKLVYGTDFFAEMLYRGAPELEGIVISGGEPFLQADALRSLLQQLDRRYPKRLGVMIYTGDTIEELREQHNPAVDWTLARTDILVDGEYIAVLDDNLPYRGSRNQRIHFLSERYSMTDFSATERKASILHTENEIILSGIPDRQTKKLLEVFCRKEPPS